METIGSLVDDVDAPDTPPGGWEFLAGMHARITGMRYRCPCGCDERGTILFDDLPPSLGWNGSRLYPSIGVCRGTHWRGRLTEGLWQDREG